MKNIKGYTVSKKFKIILVASILAGNISYTLAGDWSFFKKSTLEKALVAVENGNNDEAEKLYIQGCEENDYVCCTALGDVYNYREDLNKASDLYNKACNGGDSRGCASIKTIKNKMQKNQESAVHNNQYNEALKNCNAGSSDWCGRLGLHYYQGEGIGKNLDLAEKYLQQSCDAGYGRWCGWLGSISYGKKDYFKMLEDVNKGCNGKIAISCIDAGRLYENGMGTRLDLTKAADFYGKACDMKEQTGCENYKRLKSPQPVQQTINNTQNSSNNAVAEAIYRQTEQQHSQNQQQNLQNAVNNIMEDNRVRSMQNQMMQNSMPTYNYQYRNGKLSW